MKKELFDLLFRKIADSEWYFDAGYDAQASLLSSFAEPKDDIERSFFQYQCQRYRYSSIFRAILNVVSTIYLPFLLMRKNLIPVSMKPDSNKRAAFLCKDVDKSFIPETLKLYFDEINEYPYVGRINTSFLDKKYYRQKVLKRYWRYPYFCLKLFMRMGAYSHVINTKRYAAIISHSEYSFASSFLTDYCHTFNIEHVNVMHGEKLFDITDAFFHFDRCYVWDEHYKTLFCDMRAEPTQFYIEKPISQLPWGIIEPQKTVDYTYYLGGENHKKQAKILDSLCSLRQAGYSVAIRPHPRYNNFRNVKATFEGFIVEDPQNISIQDSIMRTKNAIALNSTVLGQAHTNGVNIIIDDVTDKKDYAQLIALRYYYVSYPHDKLSDHISKYSIICPE